MENTRQPAVLQRPYHQHNGPGPAEPSAAFQTRSSAQMDAPSWGRRRGSSASGGSVLGRDRRMSSVARAPEPSIESDARAAAVPGLDLENAPPSVDASLPPPNQAAPPSVAPQPEAPPAPSMEDEVARQKKVLQESREAAKRRKQEEWEREEAERKERIRKKLEALAELEAARSSPASSQAPNQTQPEVKPEPAAPAQATPEAAPPSELSPAEVSAAQAPTLEAQAQHPEPHVAPVKHTSPRRERLGEPASTPFGQASSPFARSAFKGAATFEEPHLPGLKQHSPQLPTRLPYQRQPSSQGVASTFSSPGEPKAQPVRLQDMSRIPSETFTPWGSSGMTSHSTSVGNVWGPPTSNRHIGNGTFDSGFPRISSGQAQQQTTPFANTAPFARQFQQRPPPQGFSQQGAPGAIDQPFGAIQPLDSRATEPAGAPAINGTSPLPETARPAYQPAPIAPPQKLGSRSQYQPQAPRDTSAWTNFAMQAQEKEREEATRLASERRGQPAPQQRWNETFKQTRAEEGWLGGPRKVVATQRSIKGHDNALNAPTMANPAPPVTESSAPHQMSSPGPSVGEQPLYPGIGQNTVRLPGAPSNLDTELRNPAGVPNIVTRMPPHAAYAANMQPLPAPPMTPTSTFQQSRFFPSVLYGGSPPPEEADHPVRSGSIRHPHVKLPAMRPKVKLPPAPSASQTKLEPVVMPPRQASYKVGHQPLVANQDWQARFNGLFGRASVTTTTPPSPPKTPPKSQAPAPAVAPATKASIDFVAVRMVTTVSLPQGAAQLQGFQAVSKPGVDDIFDGELSFGSTPRVFLPRGVQYATLNNSGRSVRQYPKFQKAVDVHSKDQLPPIILDYSKPDILRVKMPQPWAIGKEIPYVRKATSAAPSPKDRKSPGKPVKNKRNTSAVASSNPSEIPKTASPASRGPGSRAQSFQKTQNAGLSEPAGKSATPTSGPVTAGDENAPKRSSWAKPPKGQPRSKTSDYKHRT